MLLTALLALPLFGDTIPGFSGRANRIHVQVPRLDAAVTVDGRLDEPVWAGAARLTEFSQYQPVDGQPAAEHRFQPHLARWSLRVHAQEL